MPESPTTEGSIVAYLRLDSSDWNEKLDAAEAKARELGRIDPTIRVSADTAEALAKLEEVKALEERAGGTVTTTTVSKSVSSSSGSSVASDAAAKVDAVAAATKRYEAAVQAAQVAEQRAELAEMRLNDVRDKRGRTDYQVASAELALEVATNRANAADDKAIAAQRELNAARDAAARSALADAAAQEVEAAAVDKGGKSAAGNASYTGMMVAAVAAAIPLLGSMTGAAFALGGGLTAMGGAGILAVLGIKDEMTQANGVGVQYSAGIAEIKNEITSLSDTAATSMLPAFGKSLDIIRESMPELNSEVSQFSQLLGTGVSTTLEGVLNLFRLGNPLFVEAGQLIDNVAGGFLKWTTDGGLTKFIAYSEHELPIVMQTLGALGGTVEHVVEAFAPVGSEVLVTIGALADGINHIPLPVLMTLGTFAGTAFVAFKAWGAIGPIVDKVSTSLFGVGVATDAAMGPIGLVAAGVTGLVTIFAAVDGAQQQAIQTANDYARALEADNYQIGQQSEALLAKNLHDSGQLQMAHELGISTQTYTQAVMGNKDALDQVNQKIAAVTKSANEMKNGQLSGTDAQKQNAVTADVLKKSLDATRASMASGTEIAQGYKDALDAATSATQSDVSLTQQLTDAQNKAKTATDQFAQALQGLGNTNLSAAQASIAYTQAVADGDVALQKNGATLDINTQKGRDNMTALDSIASSAIATVAAQAKAGASTQDLTNDMVSARAQFISTAEKMGDTAAQANALADQYGLIPSSVTTAVKTSGLGDAQKEVANLQGQLAQIARDWTAKVNIVTSGSVPTAGHLAGFSTGGLVAQYRASGGAIDTAYLASGGNPIFQPRGTDTIPAMLTPGEFVVKQSSASQHPGFLNAYNANPAAAIDSVRRSGAKPATYNFYIYQADNPTAVAQRTAHYLASQTV